MMRIRAKEVEETKTLEKSFDLRSYLNEGWMYKTVDEAEDSDAPKDRVITGQLGLYKFVEDNCRTLDDILRLNPEELREPISVAKEEGLSPREFIEEFVEEYGDWVDIAEMLGLTVNTRRDLRELKRKPRQATKSDLKGFASKEATLNRAKRAEKGNWKNSVGEFVEKHSAEIGKVSPLGKAALVNYIETKMKPELSDEAKAKVDELVKSTRSITDLMFALYNTMLKGAGMGLHECDEVDFLEEEDNFNNEKYPKAEAWLKEHPNIEILDEVPEEFLQYDINTEDDPDQENIETAISEAGYMFISELEAALEGGMDDEYLESCAMNGVINDPTYNPPIDSWDYRIR